MFEHLSLKISSQIWQSISKFIIFFLLQFVERKTKNNYQVQKEIELFDKKLINVTSFEKCFLPQILLELTHELFMYIFNAVQTQLITPEKLYYIFVLMVP